MQVVQERSLNKNYLVTCQVVCVFIEDSLVVFLYIFGYT